MPTDEIARWNALLHWNEGLQRWQGADGSCFLWLSQATMDKYAAAWLEAQGIVAPTPVQRKAAADHCRRIGYYAHCIDPDVHVTGSARSVAARQERRGH